MLSEFVFIYFNFFFFSFSSSLNSVGNQFDLISWISSNERGMKRMFFFYFCFFIYFIFVCAFVCVFSLLGDLF